MIKKLIIILALFLFINSSSRQFIGNTNSMIIHNSNCRTIRKLKNVNKVIFYNLQEALNKGYKKCKVCM